MTPEERWNKLDYDERIEVLAEVNIDEVFRGLFAAYKFQALSFIAQDRLKEIWATS